MAGKSLRGLNFYRATIQGQNYVIIPAKEFRSLLRLVEDKIDNKRANRALKRNQFVDFDDSLTARRLKRIKK